MKTIFSLFFFIGLSTSFVIQSPLAWVGPYVTHHDGKTRLLSSNEGAVENQTQKKTYESRPQRGRGEGPYRGGPGGRYRGPGGGPGGGGRQNGRKYGSVPGSGGGAGDAPVLRLQNPLKLRRIVDAAPPRENRGGGGGGRDNRQNRGPRDDRSSGDSERRPRTIISGPDGIVSDSAPLGVGDGKGPSRGRKVVGTKDFAKRGPKAGDDDRNKRRPSLRLTTGKRGRSAEKNARRGSLKRRDRSSQKAAKERAALARRTVKLPDGPVPVAKLAELLDEKPVALIKYLMTDLGVMASMTQNLDPDTCKAVVEGLGKIIAGSEQDYYDDDEDDDEDIDEDSALATGFADEEDDEDLLVKRPPVVTIMGHVDHGKTSLLDAIRNTKVTSGEAGGITQHIAAYQADHSGNTITFIDTPGHAAFTDMRERGANITDIVVLVVAADDGVKQQTADSIVCARQAGVPLVIAINKCDLETADPNRVLTDLTSYDILTETLGGNILAAEISAKKGTGLDDLLDKVMLQAELEDLKANPDRYAQGAVVEARVQRGLGTVATTLIQKGTIKIGDIFVAGESYGKVRALIKTDGKTRVKEAGPSTPINVVGFEGIPSAGDILVVCDDEQTARDLAANRQRIAREKESAMYQSNLMGSISATFGGLFQKERREMIVVVKADVQGSAEALTRALRDLVLEDEEAIVTVKVLVSETGEVTKSDIAIASVTPGTTVIAFGVAASFDAMEDARINNVPIEYFSIIYDAIESVESRMQEVLSPTPDGEYVGAATVQEVFNIGGTGNIAGSRCTDGYIRKGANVRVMRGDKILIETKVKTLRNFKAEADRIEEGNECGIGLLDFEDYQADDVIECYVEK